MSCCAALYQWLPTQAQGVHNSATLIMAAPPQTQGTRLQLQVAKPMAVDPCGRVMFNASFADYTGAYRQYTKEDAEVDFAVDKKTRASSAGVDLRSGVVSGHGYEHASVGNGALMITHPKGTHTCCKARYNAERIVQQLCGSLCAAPRRTVRARFASIIHMQGLKAAAGCIGVNTTACGIGFDIRLPEVLESATMSFSFRFSEAYHWTAGGKMHGICAEGAGVCCTSCVQSAFMSGQPDAPVSHHASCHCCSVMTGSQSWIWSLR